MGMEDTGGAKVMEGLFQTDVMEDFPVNVDAFAAYSL